MGHGASLESLESLYRTRFDAFVRTASAITNSHESGHDAVHDAFVSAVRERSKYRADGTLEAWVWRIVLRSALKHRRRRDVLAEEPPDAIWTDTHHDGSAELRAAVVELPPRQRLMVFLRYYGDLDYRTIADLTGVQTGTVGAELHAAHRSLRSHLEEVLSRE